jgi:hypothetical protein
MFFGVNRQFDHALEQLIRRKPWEIVLNQFFDIQAADVSQLQCAVSGGIDKIAMGSVDDDKVPHLVKTRAPQFARPMLKRVRGKSLPCTRYFGYFREEFVCDCNQGFGCAFDLALPDADFQMRESRFGRSFLLFCRSPMIKP